MVQMFDLLSIILELHFSIPFQDVMGQSRFYAGGKDETEISKILTSMRVCNQYYFSIDYSNFDATISSWLISDAFSIIREAFVLSDDQAVWFDVMVHDFIHKELVLNEGCGVVHRGVPSGSMWTQIIDSLVNILAIKTYFIAMHAEAEMMTMGDDNIIFTNFDTSLDGISSYVRKNFGLDIKVDEKSAVGRSDTQQGVKFLSRFWRWTGQYRHPNQLLSRMAFPERFRNYSAEVTPEMVVYAFILTYNLGMVELIDTQRFIRENPFSKSQIYGKVDSRYLPGALAFIIEYTKKRDYIAVS